MRRALVALAALSLTLAGCDEPLFLTDEERLDQEIATEPGLAQLYATLEQHFPDDYAALRTVLLDSLAEDRSGTQGYYGAQNFMLAFMSRNMPHFAAAPQASLFDVRTESIRAIEMIAAEDVGQCARYTMAGLAHDDVLSTRAEVQLSRLTVAQVRAMAAGRDNPVEREEATEGDWLAYAGSLARAGMTDREIDDFYAGGGAMYGYTEEAQCRVGKAIYTALADLPDDASERLSALMLLPGE